MNLERQTCASVLASLSLPSVLLYTHSATLIAHPTAAAARTSNQSNRYLLRLCLEKAPYTHVDLRFNPLYGSAVVNMGPIVGTPYVTGLKQTAASSKQQHIQALMNQPRMPLPSAAC